MIDPVGTKISLWFTACSTEVNVSISFGGPSWPVSAADFKLAQISNTECVGAFFELQTGNSAPSWIIGDTFLVRFSWIFLLYNVFTSYSHTRQKNVYSVFRFNPASVGFAALSDTANAQNDVNGPVPTATIGSAVAVSATGRGGSRVSNAAAPAHLFSISAVVTVVVTSIIFGAGKFMWWVSMLLYQVLDNMMDHRFFVVQYSIGTCLYEPDRAMDWPWMIF